MAEQGNAHRHTAMNRILEAPAGRTCSARRAAVVMALLLALPLLRPVARPELDAGTASEGSDLVSVELLAINDLHGALEPRTVNNRQAGGVATLGGYLNDRRQRASNTITLHAGDLIGGSPPISSLLRDEPAIIAADLMGVEFGTVGNHEFDHGLTALRRLEDGGCDGAGNCFSGARMRYLAANVIDDATGAPIFPPYLIRDVDGVRIGFIGVTLKETGSIVLPSSVVGLTFLDEVETVNRYVAELQAQGIHAIVALVHQGGDGSPAGGVIEGVEINRIAAGLDADVDVIVSGHSHRGYRGFIAGKLVTEAYAYGTGFADISLSLDRQSGDVVSKSARIVTTYVGAVPADPALAERVAGWREQASALTARVVNVAAEPIARIASDAGESAIGNLVADAFRAAMATEIGCLNAGGERADIEAGPVTWGRLYEVQPFGNELIAVRLSGEQILRLLNQQWDGQPNQRILKCSGIRYTWDAAQPDDQKVLLTEVFVNGDPLDPGASYTLAINNFLADGGHNYRVLQEVGERTPGPTDLEALVSYVERLPMPFTAKLEDRIRRRN